MSFWIQYPNLTFDEKEHIYRWKGEPVIGNTSIISSVAVKRGNDFKPIGFDARWVKDDVARDFGIAFHKVCAITCRGDHADYPKEMRPWVEQFDRFLEEWKIIPVVDDRGTQIIEYPLYSEQLGYAGMPDLLAYFRLNRAAATLYHLPADRPIIGLFDWKSSDNFMSYWRYQTAGYEKQVREVFGIKEKIVRIPMRFKENMYVPDIRSNNPEDWIGFQSLLNVYKMANNPKGEIESGNNAYSE